MDYQMSNRLLDQWHIGHNYEIQKKLHLNNMKEYFMGSFFEESKRKLNKMYFIPKLLDNQGNALEII